MRILIFVSGTRDKIDIEVRIRNGQIWTEYVGIQEGAWPLIGETASSY
jgi:hypothetical protein